MKPDRFDVRVLRRPNLQQDPVGRKELEQHLASLPDEAENAERIATAMVSTVRRVDASAHVPVPVSSVVTEDN
jgi:hypothetical protein